MNVVCFIVIKKINWKCDEKLYLNIIDFYQLYSKNRNYPLFMPKHTEDIQVSFIYLQSILIQFNFHFINLSQLRLCSARIDILRIVLQYIYNNL